MKLNFRRKSMIAQSEKEDEEMRNDPAYMLFMDAEKATGELYWLCKIAKCHTHHDSHFT